MADSLPAGTVNPGPLTERTATELKAILLQLIEVVTESNLLTAMQLKTEVVTLRSVGAKVGMRDDQAHKLCAHLQIPIIKKGMASGYRQDMMTRENEARFLMILSREDVLGELKEYTDDET